MSFIEVLAENLEQIKRSAESIPQQIDTALVSLDKDQLADIFGRLAENRFRLEQRGKPNARVVIGNGILEVGDLPGDKIGLFQSQGYIILDWTGYRKLLRELGKVIGGNAAETNVLDLRLKADETRPQRTPPSVQFELAKMDYEFELRLAELREKEKQEDKEWQETLRRWEEEKQLRRQRLRCVKD